MYRIEKSNRRKEQRSLIKKIQKSNEIISSLQKVLTESENDAEIKSKEVSSARLRDPLKFFISYVIDTFSHTPQALRGFGYAEKI